MKIQFLASTLTRRKALARALNSVRANRFVGADCQVEDPGVFPSPSALPLEHADGDE
jgi:hypothetical protein